jgi:2-C-methyl-D-erythritol 4-phosphate cytidylyltransferase
VVTAPTNFAPRYVELTSADPMVTVIAGGRTRQDSVRLGLGVLPDEVDVVLVHDAARPFVPASTIARVLAAIEDGADAVVPAVPVADTIKRVSADGLVLGTVERAELRAAQTPQGFQRGPLSAAHQYARMANLLDVSDDAGLVERHGGKVVVVEGDARSFKITRPFDLAVAELMAAQ